MGEGEKEKRAVCFCSLQGGERDREGGRGVGGEQLFRVSFLLIVTNEMLFFFLFSLFQCESLRARARKSEEAARWGRWKRTRENGVSVFFFFTFFFGPLFTLSSRELVFFSQKEPLANTCKKNKKKKRNQKVEMEKEKKKSRGERGKTRSLAHFFPLSPFRSAHSLAKGFFLFCSFGQIFVYFFDADPPRATD